jgi:hypothetical protein
VRVADTADMQSTRTTQGVTLTKYHMDDDERAVFECAMSGEMSMSHAIGWAIRNGREQFAELLRAS